jgi:DNA polymerase-3 subunit epsilon
MEGDSISAMKTLIFDFETTGVDPLTDTPVSVGFVEFDLASRSIIEESETYFLINPGRSIPPEATAIHGITTEQARKEGVPLNEAIERIHKSIVLYDGPITGMNVSYDLTMLNTHKRLPNSLAVFDVLVLDKHFDKYRKGKRNLTSLAEHYKVESTDAHNALGDVITTANVLGSMMGRYPEIAQTSITELHEQQKLWHKEWAEGYSNWRKANGQPPLTSGEYVWPIRMADGETVLDTTPPVQEQAVLFG